MTISANVEVNVAGLSSRVDGLERSVLALDNKMEKSISALDAKIEKSVSGVETKIDQIITSLGSAGQTDWKLIFGAFSIFLTILGMIGYLVYKPIEASQVVQDVAIRDIQSSIVPRVEQQTNRENTARNLDKLERRIERIENQRMKPAR
jgi:polyhydroxyalkanoate synthesis regulator phasin